MAPLSLELLYMYLSWDYTDFSKVLSRAGMYLLFVKIVLGSSVLVDVSMTHGGDDASSIDWVSESHVLLGAAHSHAGEPQQSKSHDTVRTRVQQMTLEFF